MAAADRAATHCLNASVQPLSFFISMLKRFEKAIAKKKKLPLVRLQVLPGDMMRAWNGSGVFQWEHVRQWNLAASASVFSRAEGALMVPGALTSFSIFFRRQSQSASTFALQLWTTPIFFKPLDEVIDSTTAPYYLMKVGLETADGTLSMAVGGGGAQVFGARFKEGQPMGTLLFWEMKNGVAADATISGDIYLVPNNSGVISGASFGRMVDGEVACALPGRTARMPGRTP